ncbi:hypothetical protein BY458DRAFT_444674 [Sporodiniella umbellata]|nr:hypothetical protein BY458DRAFT_444674 [Sporodiniella umbellata]
MTETEELSVLTSKNSLKGKFINGNRRWHWWDFLSVVVIGCVFIEIVFFSTSYELLRKEKSLVTIVKRQYPVVKYTHLDTTIQSSLKNETRVYHITKEFGPAAVSNMGRYVTGLVAAQQASGSAQTAVVMPLYSFMRKLADKVELEMTIEVHGKRTGQNVAMEFRVFRMHHVFNPPVQAPNRYEWQMINNINTSVLLTPQREPAPTDFVPVYMISPGNKRPFTQSFKSPSPSDLYAPNPHISQEWQDQYFAKAAAAFIAHKATATDEESIFAPIRVVPRVDIVHVHGVSSAYIAKYLIDKKESDDLGPRPPAIVYTMHDTEELKYANGARSIYHFSEQPIADRERLHNYIYGGRMFMSKFAVDRADAITFTSRAQAAEFIQIEKEIYLRELVMDGILRKSEQSLFYGIDGAIDYYSMDYPFFSDKLLNRSMLYPQTALNNIQAQPFLYNPQNPFSLSVPDIPTYWSLPSSTQDFVQTAKNKARLFLVKRRILIEDDLKRPIVLFHGPLAQGVGLESFSRAAELLVEHNMRFIILGTRKGYPFEKLDALQKKYPDHVHVISLAKDERRWGVYCRAAADFVYVPHTTQSSTMQAMEGLLYGSAVIVRRANKEGTQKALIDRPAGERGNISVVYRNPKHPSEKGAALTSFEYYNAYFYDDQEKSLSRAIADAARDYELFLRRDKTLREEFILRMIRSALNLGWDKGHYKGAVHEYNRVYELVLRNRSFPLLKIHEVEEEIGLVSRLENL